MRINEIERTPQEPGDNKPSNDKEYHRVPGLKPVPQNPQYAYSDTTLRGSDRLNLTGTDRTFEFYHVKDGLARYIGMLYFRFTSVHGLRNPIQVSNVWLDPDFRNWGVGMMMYGVVLGLGHTIVADASQTPTARRLWVRLWRQPGVTVRGIMDVLTSVVQNPERDEWDDDAKQTRRLLKRLNAVPLQPLDRPRAQYGDDWERFSFEVQPKADGSELTARGMSLYKSGGRYDDWDPVGLYATMSQQS